MNKHYLFIGGARSGKSFQAEQVFACSDDVLYCSSYINLNDDQEMIDRIASHQKQRNQKWQLQELSYDLRVHHPQIIFDCLSIYVSNVMYFYSKDVDLISQDVIKIIEDHIKQEIDYLLTNPCVVVVSNEVGMSLVPNNDIERVYRDILGRMNGYVANQVHQVNLIVAHQKLCIKDL
ncbi:MAG: bifunctional adenosylcobinamide kinase/adenosylcobinamide-phosphate guanylyltransferase [Bacilli bacterium]